MKPHGIGVFSKMKSHQRLRIRFRWGRGASILIRSQHWQWVCFGRGGDSGVQWLGHVNTNPWPGGGRYFEMFGMYIQYTIQRRIRWVWSGPSAKKKKKKKKTSPKWWFACRISCLSVTYSYNVEFCSDLQTNLVNLVNLREGHFQRLSRKIRSFFDCGKIWVVVHVLELSGKKYSHLVMNTLHHFAQRSSDVCEITEV